MAIHESLSQAEGPHSLNNACAGAIMRKLVALGQDYSELLTRGLFIACDTCEKNITPTAEGNFDASDCPTYSGCAELLSSFHPSDYEPGPFPCSSGRCPVAIECNNGKLTTFNSCLLGPITIQYPENRSPYQSAEDAMDTGDSQDGLIGCNED